MKRTATTQLPLVAHDATPIEKLSAYYRRLNYSFETIANEVLATTIANRMRDLRYVLTRNERGEVEFVRLHTREHRTWLTNREQAYKPPPKQLTRSEWLVSHRLHRLGKDHPDDRRAFRNGDAALAVAVAKVCHEMHRRLMAREDGPSIDIFRYGKKGPSVIEVEREHVFGRKTTIPVVSPGILVRYSPVRHFIFTNTRGKEYRIEFDSEIGRQMIGHAVARKIIGNE